VGSQKGPETFVISAFKVVAPGIDALLLACLDQALCFFDPWRA